MQRAIDQRATLIRHRPVIVVDDPSATDAFGVDNSTPPALASASIAEARLSKIGWSSIAILINALPIILTGGCLPGASLFVMACLTA